MTAPARRLLVREMTSQGLSKRRALTVLRMSASALRYAPRADRNVELRQRILALPQRHKRYGVGMIYLKLRQEGILVNYKRVERLYQDAKLQVRRRKRKKVPAGERQPLFRPVAPNEVWSMDFVFDRTVEGRVIKCLTVVDDATHEAVVIEVERASPARASRACWIAWRSLAACPRSFATTTARSSAARRWLPGPTSVACNCA